MVLGASEIARSIQPEFRPRLSNSAVRSVSEQHPMSVVRVIAFVLFMAGFACLLSLL
jgi:hypothetical protein